MTNPSASLTAPDLERALLGACILRPGLLLEVDVQESDFGSDRHRAIWRALLHLHAEGDGVDTVLLRDLLDRQGKLALVGGDEYLLGLTDTVPVLDRPATKRIRELARLRTLREAAVRTLAVIDEADLEKVQAAVSSLQVWATEAVDTNVLTAYDLALLPVQELSGASKRVLRVHPGLERMADCLGDLAVGTMTIIGAQNNVGKSSLALEMCAAIAARGVGCGYISCEDPKTLVGGRILGMYAGITSQRIERRNVHAADWPRITQACNTLHDVSERFMCATLGRAKHIDVCATITRMAQRGAKIVLVDYLQAIRYAGKVQDRRNEVSEVFRAIKAHCDQVGVALVLFSQLTRPEKGKEGREPTKHDLKESGDIEDAAENIVVMWRTVQEDFAPVHLKIVKGKSGGVGQQWTMQRSQESGRLLEVRDADHGY